MRITHFRYNSFIISTDSLRIAIDPGGELYHLKFNPIIPEEDWQSLTHIFVTHADPDHHWHTDRVAQRSDAPIICGTKLTKVKDSKRYMLGPRSRGLSFSYCPNKLIPVDVGQSIDVGPIRVSALAAQHGPLTMGVGPFRKTFCPGPDERIGYGAIGFLFEIDGKTLVNLGDTLNILEQWRHIPNPDVLMLPIGGDSIGNTMGVDDALEVVSSLGPRIVIPCHFNLPTVLKRNGNPTDAARFANQVEQMGMDCRILQRGESIVI